jgi:cysteine synthase
VSIFVLKPHSNKITPLNQAQESIFQGKPPTISQKTLTIPETEESYESRIKQVKANIGNTPMALMENVNGNELLAKLEYYNPYSRSVKDRTAAFLLTGPIERGEINPLEDKIWIEASSGNLGIAYGKIGKYLGLKTHIVVPSIVGKATYERVQENAFSCEVAPGGYCPRGEQDGAIKRVADIWLSDTDKYVFLDQYSNPDNIRAHEETTGPEFWEQSEGKITTLVLAPGTGGTIIGTARFLKSQNPEIQVIAVKPQMGHHIQGVRNYEESLKPLLFQDNESIIDTWVEVTDKEAFDATASLWQRGFKVGTSSGLNYAAARKILRSSRNAKVATLFPDSYLNSQQITRHYISTGEIIDAS